MKKTITFFLITALILTSILPLSAREDAASYILFSSDTGQTLLEKDSKSPADPSHLIRLMICYLAVKNFDPEDEISYGYGFKPLPGSDYAFESQSTYKVSVLLKLAILSGDPNAVYVTALSLAENADQLASVMNEEAKRMGLSDTQFIFTEKDQATFSYTTLKDTAIFLSNALQDPTFKEYYCMQAAILEQDGVLIKNKNKMVLSAGISKNTGGMVSSYEETGEKYMAVSFCSNMVSAVNSTALDLIFVANHLAEEDYDSYGEELISGAINTFYRMPAVNAGDVLLAVPLGNETLNLTAQSTAYCITRSGEHALVSQITFSMDKGYDLVEIQPPVFEDTKLGTAHILLYDNTTIDVPVVAGNSIYFKNDKINEFYTTLLNNQQLLFLLLGLAGIELLLLAAKLYKHFHK